MLCKRRQSAQSWTKSLKRTKGDCYSMREAYKLLQSIPVLSFPRKGIYVSCALVKLPLFLEKQLGPRFPPLTSYKEEDGNSLIGAIFVAAGKRQFITCYFIPLLLDFFRRSSLTWLESIGLS